MVPLALRPTQVHDKSPGWGDRNWVILIYFLTLINSHFQKTTMFPFHPLFMRLSARGVCRKL